MAAQAGKDLLVKIDDGTGTFVTVAGLRTRHATISGTGIFKDGASDLLLQQCFFSGLVKTFQFVVPAFGILKGAFVITALVYKADHAQGVMFDLTVESAGAITFTPL